MKNNLLALGFTLLELIITLSITAILISAGIPGLSQLINNYKIDNKYQRLMTLVQYARAESVNYQSQVLLCPTTNEVNCIDQWNENLMVFIDKNNDEERNENEDIFRIIEKTVNDPIQLHRSLSGSRRYLRFKPDGSTGNQNGRLTFCHTSEGKLYAKQLVIYMTGRVRKASDEEAESAC